jgi:hypothetical protein
MGVIIGMDPHKRSATIEVVNQQAAVLAAGRFGTDKSGYAQMLAAGRTFADRAWAAGGCHGTGKHIAHRLVHVGETVVDVPPKLSAQVRVLATGNGRRLTQSMRTWWRWSRCAARSWSGSQADDELVVMGMLADRRDELAPPWPETKEGVDRP